MPTKKKPGKKPAPKAAAQPPADDEESPRTQRQKRRQKNTENLPSTKKQKQQELQDDDGSDVDYTSNEEEEQVLLSKKELQKLLKSQAMVENFIKAQEKTEQARLKSGRAKIPSDVLGRYNPKTMTPKQKEIQKHFKRYVFRLVKFLTPNTKKNAAKAVYLALTGDLTTKATSVDEERKY